MRWRYLILGLFLAVPTATAIHHWPQRPAYCIPGEGRYILTDDPLRGELLFFCCDENAAIAPRIERRDAQSGALSGTTSLDCTSLPNWPRQGFWVRISDDRTILTWLVSDWSPTFATNYVRDFESPNVFRVATFDATTGRNVGHISEPYVGRHVNISPNGERCAVVLHYPNRLSVRDVRTGTPLFVFPFPGGYGEDFSSCFSPDGHFFLFQRLVGEKVGRTLHLLNVETGNIERTYELPIGRTFDEWRPNELRTHEVLLPEGPRYRRYRHDFDGQMLGPGIPDGLLDTTHQVLMSANGRCDNETWVGQFGYHESGSPVWMELISKIETMTGLILINRRPKPSYVGYARIVDRATHATRFQMDIPSVFRCRLVMDGALLVTGGKDVFSDPKATNAPTTIPPFEIYRTDVWPRWIWTTLGTGALVAAFALLARWQHVVIRRHRLNELRV
jgi:hypothetical protein